jgi:hypothetical protein
MSSHPFLIQINAQHLRETLLREAEAARLAKQARTKAAPQQRMPKLRLQWRRAAAAV